MDEQTPGTGLGLNIVSGIVRSYQGDSKESDAFFFGAFGNTGSPDDYTKKKPPFVRQESLIFIRGKIRGKQQIDSLMGLLPDWNSPQLSHLTGYEPLTLWFWFLKSGALRMSEALLEAQNGDVMPLSAHNGNEEPGSQKNSQDKKEDQKDSGPTTSDSAPTTAQVSSFSAGSGGGGDPPNYHNGNQKKEPEDGSESQINKDNTKKQRYKKPLINVCKI